jgi:hypothetical protein
MARKRKARKKPEPKAPGKYLRSSSGVPARLVKTCHRSDDDLWLYRLDYGDITGNGLWTLARLIEVGVKFLKRRPSDLPERMKA